MFKSVLLDTSFFLRFLNEKDDLFTIADNYFKYFLQQNIDLYISTISIGEYCIGGNIDELPLRNLKILPYNYNHGIQAGQFGKILFQLKKIGQLEVSKRVIIPNDVKLFSQCEIEENITHFVTSDSESIKMYKSLKNEILPNFEIIDIKIPHTEYFGLLNL
ncbi:MAG: hypothetical protein WAR79_17995 [Melioribacteraceae bacterium]